MSPDENRFILIDGHALIYRAFYAFPNLTGPSGQLLNAVYGFSRILLSVINDYHPEYIAVAFDRKEPTKRSETFEDYKAHRPEMPDELKPQIAKIKEVTDALNIPRFSKAGYEADDLIGTIVNQLTPDKAREEDLILTVVTGDKDLLQLVDDQVTVFIPGRGRGNYDKEYRWDDVEDKLGVAPDRVVELKALMGDSSDNIPGVKGVGPKTALKLLEQYADLDEIYQGVERIESGESTEEDKSLLKGALLKKLIKDKDNAYLSRELAKIEKDVPIEFSLEKCKVSDYDKHEVVELFQQFSFDSLIKMLPQDEFEQGVQDALF